MAMGVVTLGLAIARAVAESSPPLTRTTAFWLFMLPPGGGAGFVAVGRLSLSRDETSDGRGLESGATPDFKKASSLF